MPRAASSLRAEGRVVSFEEAENMAVTGTGELRVIHGV